MISGLKSKQMNRDILYLIGSHIDDLKTFHSYILVFRDITNKHLLMVKWKKYVEDRKIRKQDEKIQFRKYFYEASDLWDNRYKVNDFNNKYIQLYGIIYKYLWKIVHPHHFDNFESKDLEWFLTKMKDTDEKFKNYISNMFSIYYRFYLLEMKIRSGYDFSCLETSKLKF